MGMLYITCNLLFKINRLIHIRFEYFSETSHGDKMYKNYLLIKIITELVLKIC